MESAMAHAQNQQDDVPDQTAAQHQWKEIAENVRTVMEKKVKCIPEMTPAQCFDLVRALREAFWLEMNAQTFDSEVARNESEFD